MSRHARLTLILATMLTLAACNGTTGPSAAPTMVLESPQFTALPSTSSPSGAATPESSLGVGTTHVVVANDTLSGLATQFGTSVAQLQAWNQSRYPSLATDPGTIQLGWTLIVVGDPAITPLPSGAAGPTASPSA